MDIINSNIALNYREKNIIEKLKVVGNSKNIDSAVFDLLINDYFRDFINQTFISGGSSVLKGKKIEDFHKKAVKELILNLNLNTNQTFLNIIGLSGSGKSEVRNRLQKNIPYLPLDEKLKVFLKFDGIKEISIFKERNEFDAKKFEYVMYCSVLVSGKYSGYIIDHSGGSPLQVGFQALSEGLAGEFNEAIHLNINSETIADNIAHNILYENFQSVKEPVRDAIGIALGYVKNGYEKEDPIRTKLVEHEKDKNDILGSLRDKYKNFCNKNKRFETTTESLNKFEKTLASKNDLKIFNLHKEKAMDYVSKNEWRRAQFSEFCPRTKNCTSLAMACDSINDYLERVNRFKKLKLVSKESNIPDYIRKKHQVSIENFKYIFSI